MTNAKPKASGLAPRGFRLAELRSRIEGLAGLPGPNLAHWPRLALAALAVTLVASVVLAQMYVGKLGSALGDTDDATRLMMVRQLLRGGGWWSGQHLMRFQPPVGVYMHWSRLLDGGIASLDVMFRLVLSAADADLATRFLWPLLWIFPAAAAVMLIARRLGLGLLGNAAVIVVGVILVTDIPLYIQFRPGRIDHHDVQMTLAFLALAGAIQLRPNVIGAVLAGLATGLGLAVGLEGLVFDAVIGAAIGLQFAFDPRTARDARVYALALAASTVLAFLIQTPPWRWGVPACDALASNLTAAIAVAGVGLYLATRFTAGRSVWWRLGALAVVGALAGATYIGIYPRCRDGFFADVDPRIRPIWLNYVQEVRPIWVVTKHNPGQGVQFIAAWAWGVICWLLLGLRRERRCDMAWWLSGACLAMGIVAGSSVIRASGYAEWFSVPIVAALVIEVLARLGYRSLFVVVIAALVGGPMTASGLSVAAYNRVAPLFPAKPKKGAQLKKGPGAHPAKAVKAALPAKKAPAGEDGCFINAAYAPLAAARPTGLVLSEIDLGAFVVALSDHSALNGPYHRMGWGILKAHAILKAPADARAAGDAYDLARAAGVTYVLECRAHGRHGDRSDMTKLSLQKQLDAGHTPDWLQPLTPPTAALQVFRVTAPPVAVSAPELAPAVAVTPAVKP